MSFRVKTGVYIACRKYYLLRVIRNSMEIWRGMVFALGDCRTYWGARHQAERKSSSLTSRRCKPCSNQSRVHKLNIEDT